MASNSLGGYDLNWLEGPPDDLKCLICLCVARDPHQHPGDDTNECGKVFCHGCITKYQRGSSTCPNCRKGLTHFKDAKSARQIRALKVKCNNLKNGCGWTGKLGDLDTHRCDFEPVPCKYARVGCEEKPLRKDLSKHEEDAMQLHLQLTTDTVLELTEMNFKSTCTLPRTIRLTNYLIHKRDKDPFYSPPFYTSYTGYKMCFKVYANGIADGAGTYVSVGTNLMKGDNDDSLSWPFTGSVTVKLLNQLEDKNHHKWTLTFTAGDEASERVVDGERATQAWGWHKFISHSDVDYNTDKNTQYLKDDTLVFRVSVQVPNYKLWLE